ncbi:UDP-N-acetylmuramate dehydrogenase [Enterococcus faecalis M7]|nr:UDP-N-acetylmuramate dehydrogenase [Enterococcus faecalis M7]
MNTKAMLETLNEITLLVDEPLKNVTFTKTGGPADVLALPKTKKKLKRLWRIAENKDFHG